MMASNHAAPQMVDGGNDSSSCNNDACSKSAVTSRGEDERASVHLIAQAQYCTSSGRELECCC